MKMGFEDKTSIIVVSEYDRITDIAKGNYLPKYIRGEVEHIGREAAINLVPMVINVPTEDSVLEEFRIMDTSYTLDKVVGPYFKNLIKDNTRYLTKEYDEQEIYGMLLNNLSISSNVSDGAKILTTIKLFKTLFGNNASVVIDKLDLNKNENNKYFDMVIKVSVDKEDNVNKYLSSYVTNTDTIHLPYDFKDRLIKLRDQEAEGLDNLNYDSTLKYYIFGGLKLDALELDEIGKKMYDTMPIKSVLTLLKILDYNYTINDVTRIRMYSLTNVNKQLNFE